MISKIVNLSRVIKSSRDVFAGTGKENFLKSQINDKLVVLQNTIPTQDDTPNVYDMHATIVNLYVELTAAKDKLHELRDAEETIDEIYESV